MPNLDEYCAHGVRKTVHCLRCDRDRELLLAGLPPPTILTGDEVFGSGEQSASAVASGEGALLPCPFCIGGKPKMKIDTQAYLSPHHFIVLCECGASGPNMGTEEGAIAAWNRRAAPSAPADGEWVDLRAYEFRASADGKGIMVRVKSERAELTRLTVEVQALRQQYSELSCRHTDVQRASDAAHRDCKTFAAEVQALKSDIAKYVDAAAEQATEVERLRREIDNIRRPYQEVCRIIGWNGGTDQHMPTLALELRNRAETAEAALARAQKVVEAAQDINDSNTHTVYKVKTGERDVDGNINYGEAVYKDYVRITSSQLKRLQEALSTPKGAGATERTCSVCGTVPLQA